MPEISLYVDTRGRSPVKDFTSSLNSVNGKSAKNELNRINRQIHLLEELGTWGLSTKVAKHIRGDIWELRPGKTRILFFSWNHTYILLHAFYKTTNETPEEEIEQAEREIKDWKARHG